LGRYTSVDSGKDPVANVENGREAEWHRNGERGRGTRRRQECTVVGCRSGRGEDGVSKQEENE